MKWQHVIGQNGDVKGCQLKSNSYDKVSGLVQAHVTAEKIGNDLLRLAIAMKIVISSFRIKVEMQSYTEDSLSP